LFKAIDREKKAVDQPLHLLFVDLEKTYDSVPLLNLWKVLEHYSISNIFIRAIKRSYEKSFSKIKIGKQLNSGFWILYNKRTTTRMQFIAHFI